MTKIKIHRGNYTYDLIGTVLGKQKRKNPTHSQYFYQLNITCENYPQVRKLFAFQSKLNPTIWQAIEQSICLAKKYHFQCRNYKGSYYLIDWQELPKELPKPSLQNNHHDK